MNKTPHVWTKEEKEYLFVITPGHHYKEIQKLINKKFDLELSLRQINSAIARYKLKTGFTGHFKKSQEPWNKGIKGLNCGGKETQFKKGNIPHNYLPLGSERINGDGYIDIKIAAPNKWKAKHILIWKEHNGTIPKGYCVIFGDGDNRNFDIENLMLVSRKQLCLLNKHKLIQKDANLTRAGVIIADLKMKITERKAKAK